MKKTEFLKKIKAKEEQNKLNRKDARFTKAIAFLKAKGLLDTNLPIRPVTGMKMQLNDVIWAGKNVDPRIFEVLPAAILHYRRNFLGAEKLPKDLEQVLKAIRNNADLGPAFEGVPFEKMKHWANTRLKDKRTKPANEKKIPKYLMLHVKHLNKIAQLVKQGKFKNQTSAIEAAIERL